MKPGFSGRVFFISVSSVQNNFEKKERLQFLHFQSLEQSAGIWVGCEEQIMLELPSED